MKSIPLTQGYVAIVDDCDSEALSAFRWHVCKNARTVYAERKLPPVDGGKWQRHLQMHRVILNAKPGQFVDHVNGDTLDNRRCNLRFATRSQNAMNSRKQRVPRSSQYIGVTHEAACTRRPWKAHICLNNKISTVGRFPTELEAARARDARAMELHGEFARLNFAQPEPNGAASR